MSIINDLREIISADPKTFGRVNDYDFTTRTGFTNIDYLNGQIVMDDNR